MTVRLLLAGMILLLAACNGSDTDKPEPLAEPEKTTRCFYRGTDSLSIRLDRIGDLANGILDGTSPEGEKVSGTFTGALEEDLFVVLYTYADSEGKKKLEVLMKPADGGLRLAEGERVTIQGITLFKDRGQVRFGELIPEVACP